MKFKELFLNLEKIFSSGEDLRLPILDKNFQSNIPGLFVIGSLSGKHLIKDALAQGYEVASEIASELENRPLYGEHSFQLAIVGASAAGLSAAFAAEQRELKYLLLDSHRFAESLRNLPPGKQIWSHLQKNSSSNSLWFEDCTKEELLKKWQSGIQESQINLHTYEEVLNISKKGEIFLINTADKEYHALRVILAINHRALHKRQDLAGEDSKKVFHQFFSTFGFQDHDLFILGNTDQAAQAALALAEDNRVTISHSGKNFHQLSNLSRAKLTKEIREGKILSLLNAEVQSIDSDRVVLSTGDKRTETIKNDFVFILSEEQKPQLLLDKIGLKRENTWKRRYYFTIALIFLIVYSFIAISKNPTWFPFNLITTNSFHWFGQPMVVYTDLFFTLLLLSFGLSALKKWSKQDLKQGYRYLTLMMMQFLIFVVPHFIFGLNQLANKFISLPNLAGSEWGEVKKGLYLPWPLYFEAFSSHPVKFYFYWSIIITFIILPISIFWFGKRYCSWICPYGALAETLGDRWRHLAPKGSKAIKYEYMNILILALALVLILVSATNFPFSKTLNLLYSGFINTWLILIIPISLYPFLGGRIWCRFWCPLGRLIGFMSRFWSSFKINSNDQCLACGLCNRFCQLGIDVMSLALEQKVISNKNTSCNGCGICISICPANVLQAQKSSFPFSPRITRT